MHGHTGISFLSSKSTEKQHCREKITFFSNKPSLLKVRWGVLNSWQYKCINYRSVSGLLFNIKGEF